MTAYLRRRVLIDAVTLLGAFVIAAVVTDVAGASGPELIAAGVNVDLNVAALVVALGTLVTGLIAYARLKSERPKIVQEVGAITEERLRKALETSWEEVDRCRLKIREGELVEAWLEQRVDDLEAALRASGLALPPAPPRPTFTPTPTSTS